MIIIKGFLWVVTPLEQDILRSILLSSYKCWMYSVQIQEKHFYSVSWQGRLSDCRM